VSIVKANLNQPARTYPVTRTDILVWALDQDHGGLPSASAMAFAGWLNEVWEDWAEDEEATVEQVLQGAVEHWCGGRTF